MKQTLLFIALALSVQGFAIELPTKYLGKYKAEVPSFQFEHNGKTFQASAYPVSIHLKSNSLIYEFGKLDLYGVYTNLVKGTDVLNLSVNVTNEKSVSFNLNLGINKNNQTILVAGLKGIPEVNMRADELVFSKQSIENTDPRI